MDHLHQLLKIQIDLVNPQLTTRIQYKNLNIHKHLLSSKGIQHLAINIQ